jgi:4-hydroxy-3-methylbut-2-enyl diphosphate reductase
MGKPALELILASPRGFCAGVVRAVDIVERALAKAGGPVYVRHEIVHNRQVVERLEGLGAIFVEELDDVPDDATVVFSAHGVPKSVGAEADRRKLSYLDATCPLVSKVHHEAERLFAEGRTTILIGHAGHPEVIGTLGQLPPGAVVLVQTMEDIVRLPFARGDNLAFITQTTLSVDDTAEIVAKLRQRYPSIVGPRKEDICYATSNRQASVKAIAQRCDAILVIGSANSSNSQRLAEVAIKAGCKMAKLISSAAEIDWPSLQGVARLGLTAGASAPEELVQEVIGQLRGRFDVKMEEVSVVAENVRFRLPRALEA